MHQYVNPRYASRAFACAMHSEHHHSMNLMRIRQAKGLSQRDLAEMVDMNQSTIQRAEQSHPSAKLATYQACADALEVSLCDIFCEDRSSIEGIILRTFRKIPSEKQEKVLSLLELLHAEDAEKDPGTHPTDHR
ncbi:helix-turn-helix domain-containing protein [Pseudooceanicola spongiae]|nr:helix-turn-helix transcriptional regulator [Pseudooceanicola spongiae]